MKPGAIGLLSIILLFFLTAVIYSSEPFQAQIAVPRDTPNLPMTFSHRDHGKQPCASCHHNYIDNTGHDLCLTCHLTRVDLTFKVQRQFHDLCTGCHEEKQHEGAEAYGPVRSCTGCHIEDHQP